MKYAWQEIRMLAAILLIRLIVFVVPRNEEGFELVRSILDYLERAKALR